MTRYQKYKNTYKKASLKWYHENKEHAQSLRAAYRLTATGRAKHLHFNAKDRAKKAGEPFTLTLAYVTECIERGSCPKTGFAFDLSPATGRRNNPYAPSLDRRDAAKPYTDENVQIVCWQYNVMKHELSEKELLTFCKKVLDTHVRSCTVNQSNEPLESEYV